MYADFNTRSHNDEELGAFKYIPGKRLYRILEAVEYPQDLSDKYIYVIIIKILYLRFANTAQFICEMSALFADIIDSIACHYAAEMHNFAVTPAWVCSSLKRTAHALHHGRRGRPGKSEFSTAYCTREYACARVPTAILGQIFKRRMIN
ncbi:hypothetical protein X777_13230 [Ooceraea biroi]|uniref:Uncharacterized protein n=1 Tax=Ooceraea biroi TaxID=2015173 RepID=A0A026VY05_OOCBI|nr:hypothetical protein X777_13230 [Ooceraea biroi]